MRRRSTVFALLLLAAGGALVACSDSQLPRATPRAPRTFEIQVVFSCNGLRSVDPWRVDAIPGDTIEWVLDSARSDVSEIFIEKKAWKKFPFREVPKPGGPGRPIRAGDIKRAQGTHQYNIEADCPSPDGRIKRSVIDPDIIIDVNWMR